MKKTNHFGLASTASFACALFLGLCTLAPSANATKLDEVMKARGLTQKDLLAAAKTYVPSGGRDQFIALGSGGASGQLFVYGIPSMRILKYIAVFTPEPSQGYGFDDGSKKRLAASSKINGTSILFGHTQHPALSETNGAYDGQYAFVGDKANPRIAIIDMATFATRQIIVNPLMSSAHGSAVVSPNTDYILETTQYPAPLDKKYAPLSQFNEKYRGAVTYWKFDRKKGRIDEAASFSLELPPYAQGMSDFGKGASDGWSFTSSICTERYVGGTLKGRAPFEAGCAQKDSDFVHMINWKKAAKIAKAGKTSKINGHRVIMMETAIKQGILVLIPAPKNPQALNVSPDGKFFITAGKFNTQASVYSFAKIMAQIKAKKFAGKDAYGNPIVDLKKSLHKQVSIGFGPGHSQYDSKPCIAYTSIHVDSQITKWDYCNGKVLDKIDIHYNGGHLVTMEGDSAKPKGKYLVSLNALSIDRFNPVGPLHPQNHQLIDISGDKMQLLYDMPVPLGLSHHVVAIKADKLKAKTRTKPGTNSATNESSEFSVRRGDEKIVKKEGIVHVYGTVIRSHFTPEIIEVEAGDTVALHLTNVEHAQDETLGFTLHGHNVTLSIEPGKTVSATFKVPNAGVFAYYCAKSCSALNGEMQGILLVRPKGTKLTPVVLKESTSYTKADYDKQIKSNIATQDIINDVVTFITKRNFEDFPLVIEFITDATDQLNFAASSKKKAEKYAAKGDWQNATLWAQQWFQYQMKTAASSQRAKIHLRQNSARLIKE